MTQLSSWLSTLQSFELVLLIDEYDAPLTHCLDKPELFEEVRATMSELFLTLKSHEGRLRFFFMTGITKLSNTSIFCAFNNLQDISLDPFYGALLGYTEDEISKYFSSYIAQAAKALLVSPDKVRSELKDYYDGFSFDERAHHHVYCPWSVLNFLNRPDRGFQNYWYSSGGQPSVLMKYLSNHALSQPITYAEVRELRLSELNAARQYDDIGLDVLLTQAGYYTIREVTEDGYALLGYPNWEVAGSMAELYANELTQGKRIRSSAATPIRSAMAKGALEAVIDYFNAAVTAIDYHRYPIKDEASCRAYMQVLLIGAAMIPKVEIHNAHGRSGMEVEVNGQHWVFEFKFARRSSEVTDLLDEAINQLRTRHYGETSVNTNRISVALVFDSQKRRFTAWQRA